MLEAGGDVRGGYVLPILAELVYGVDQRRFEAGEAVIVAARGFDVRQLERVRVALAAQLIQQRAARIRQAEHTRGLVKRLARSVVHRLSQQRVHAVVLHAHDVRMAARGDQAHKRRLKVLVREVVGAHVAFDVVDRDERLVRSIG